MQLPVNLYDGSGDNVQTQYSFQSFIILVTRNSGRKYRKRQSTASCKFVVEVDGIQVASIDLANVTPNTPYDYTTDPFAPTSSGSRISQRVICPYNVQMPQVEASAGVLVVKPPETYVDTPICGVLNSRLKSTTLVGTKRFTATDGTPEQRPAGCSQFCSEKTGCKSFLLNTQGFCYAYNSTATSTLKPVASGTSFLWEASCSSFSSDAPTATPDSPNCGITGRTSTSATYRPYIQDLTRTHASYAKCSELCVQQNCTSLAYSVSTCALYKFAVKDYFLPFSSSGVHFYDAACIPT